MAFPLRQTWCYLGKRFEKGALESQSSVYNTEIELKKVAQKAGDAGR